MFTKCDFTKVIFSMMVILALAACAPQPIPVDSSPEESQGGSIATSAPVATSTQVEPASPQPTAPLPETGKTPAPISLEAVDDANMSRLRLVNLVAGSAATDMYVDGQIGLLGSRQTKLAKMRPGLYTGFLYVEPGVHQVAVVPNGEGLEAAMIATDVTLEPGHRYTVAVMGQKEDAQFTPLVIDETEAIANVRTSPEQNIMILINNAAGADTIDIENDGVGPKDVPYGGFVAAPIKAGKVNKMVTYINGILFDSVSNTGEFPGVDFIHGFVGSISGGTRNIADGPFHSDLTALEWLKQFTGGDFSFNTFLTAMEKAGLNDFLTKGPYLIIAPLDSAFETMPDQDLEALMADPEALNKYLRNYIVEGYYPTGGIALPLGCDCWDGTVTNLNGEELHLGDDLSFADSGINGLNGTRILHATKLLPLPTQ